MLEKLNQDMISAMKNHEKEKLQVIRGVKASIKQEVIDKKVEESLELLIDVVVKQIKMRKESIEEFKKANRQDLIDKTEEEINILEVYLPKQLTKEETEIIIDEVIASVNAKSSKDMGIVLKELTPKIKGKYDMKEASQIVKDKLSNI